MEVVSEEKKKLKLVIAIPGNSFSGKFLISWTNTLNTLWQSQKYDIVISPGISSYVTFARMQTLGLDVLKGLEQKPFNGMEFDIWITIDSDIIFTPEQLIQLIESTEIHPIVSGVYRMADLTNLAFVEKCDINYFSKHGRFEFMNIEKFDNWKKENPEETYMKVNYTGMGFMAIRSDVLNSLIYPYFNGELQELKNSEGKLIRDMMSEDVCFCKNLQNKGYDIMINTNIRVGHEKLIVI
jgi:hypothetical protein